MKIGVDAKFYTKKVGKGTVNSEYVEAQAGGLDGLTIYAPKIGVTAIKAAEKINKSQNSRFVRLNELSLEEIEEKLGEGE